MSPKARRLSPAEFDGPFDEEQYRKLWGRWHGRERELYIESARLMEPLSWKEVVAACGVKVRALSGLVEEAYSRLTSEDVPERLRSNGFQVQALRDRAYLVTTYSAYDPLLMSEQLARTLPYFDGRPTSGALEAIRNDLGVSMGRSLLRQLVDFGLLAAADPPRAPGAEAFHILRG